MISLTLLIFIYLFVFHLHLPIIHMSSLSSPHFSQQEQATKVTSYLPAVCYVSFCNCIKKILSKEFSILDTMDLFFLEGWGAWPLSIIYLRTTDSFQIHFHFTSHYLIQFSQQSVELGETGFIIFISLMRKLGTTRLSD